MHVADTSEVTGPQAKVGAIPFIVMMAGLASQSLLFSLPPPLLPAMAQTYGANGPFITQMVFAVASLGLMITSIISGLLVRALGVRGLLIISSALYGLAGLIPWLTADTTILLLSRLLAGGGCGLLTTGCTMLLAHCYSGSARSRALGYQTALGSITGLVALLIAGSTVGSLGWHPAFLLYGLFGLPIMLLAIVGVAPVPLPAQSAERGMGEAFANIWPICVAACLLMMVPLLVGSETPFVLTTIGVTSPLIQSGVISMVTIMSAVSGTLFGSVQTTLGVQRTFAVSLVLSAAGLVLVALAGNAWIAGIGCALFGLGLGMFIPHLWVLATTLVPERTRGHAIGLLTTSMFLGGFLYPFLFGAVQKLFGLGGGIVAIAVVLTLTAIAIMMARRTRLAGGAVA